MNDPSSKTSPKALLNANATLVYLKSFLLNQAVLRNFTILVVSQSVILLLCVLNFLLFLCCVRNKETTKFVKNNILIFSIIIFVCCGWNIINLITNYNIRYSQAESLMAIKGNNGAVGGRLNDLFGFLIGGSGGVGGVVNEWIYGNGECGDQITEHIFSKIYTPFDNAFLGGIYFF